MRNLMALFGFCVLLFLGIGYFRGWYDFNVKSGDKDGTIQFEGSVHTEKGMKDAGKAIQSGVDFVGDVAGKLKTKGEAEAKAPPVTPPANSPKPNSPWSK
jgi:hypothetical protein